MESNIQPWQTTTSREDLNCKRKESLSHHVTSDIANIYSFD